MARKMSEEEPTGSRGGHGSDRAAGPRELVGIVTLTGGG